MSGTLRCGFGLLVLLAVSVSVPASGQKTGTLTDRAILPAGRTLDREAQQKFAFRAASIDPSLTSSSRASSWSLIVAHEEGNEARLQMNLCDIGKICGEALKADITLAGPIDTDTHFSTITSFDGLTGKNRVSAGFTFSDSSLLLPVDRWSYFGRVSAARPTFEYRSTPNLDSHAEKHLGYSLTGGASRVFSLSETVLFGFDLSYRYENTYASAESQNVCSPVSFGTPGTMFCESLVIGPPTNKWKHSIVTDFKLGRSDGVGAHLIFLRDIKNGINGIDIPLYLIPHGDDGLGGGVRAMYRRGSKKISWSVFVSAIKF